ncbi:MAG: HTH domain-containing protein [Bacteroidales bacterium]|jgi:predicted DNA-binding transcriptional regulator YafY|nr:HTH domain-containing protein [Bacteroidales bacterium]MBP9511513.1 HTH domain-containing protein [Bacteroidales bacterium]MBP9588241.1 HTH domain-containing protein [Bacteroidales bacterium]NMD16336.1 HTH domain-containing protein [Bacteroidales bacterium]
MNFVDRKQKLEYILELIEKGKTGTAEELSKRVYVSLPTLYRYISDLRRLGYQIGYCTYRKTYCLVLVDKK